MIQSKLIMAFTSADDEQTDRISNRLGVEADHEDDPGTTIKAQCCECDTFSWYHLDQFPIDVRDMIVRYRSAVTTRRPPGIPRYERLIHNRR